MTSAGPSPTRFLDRFSVVLFDLHGTLMFDQDRFGPEEDYYATYRELGGHRLDRETVMASLRACHAEILADYHAAARYDDFPTLAEAFRSHAPAAVEDIPMLERVFAEHERGRMPASHAAFVRHLATTHQLGVVSNICARPDPWIAAFEGAGVRSSFTTLVFSSEGRSIKPSPDLFRRALSAFPAGARVLFVGDSLARDIRPARRLGLGTAWIAQPDAFDPAADVVVQSATDLEHLTVGAPT